MRFNFSLKNGVLNPALWVEPYGYNLTCWECTQNNFTKSHFNMKHIRLLLSIVVLGFFTFTLARKTKLLWKKHLYRPPKKGKIIIVQSADLFTLGATRTVTHENFFVDDVQVLGVKTWTNNGTDANGQFSFSKVAQGIQLIYADGTSVSWNTNRTNTLIEGGNTATFSDNVWSIVGATSGVNRNGEPFSVTTTEPMIKKATCRWIVEGVLTLTRDGRTATLNFGDDQGTLRNRTFS
jgi:hypothetical protein